MGHGREGPVRRRDEAASEGDALGLVGVKERRARAFLNHRRELPGEVHRVGDAGVHALGAHGTMDVRRIAE